MTELKVDSARLETLINNLKRSVSDLQAEIKRLEAHKKEVEAKKLKEDKNREETNNEIKSITKKLNKKSMR